ncbi:hypothetical protein MN116_007122 [Schistosoma mekongi]|uniref:Uncharacterized protein n=1 Tax=Schistosoma mekongi TaxID=38744 RepID=A0AAE2D468_SCHME|nr:hypothetical protein MN116_007122 [Schistosoma mekongi]
MSKRRRRDLDSCSSSGSSDFICDSSLWKFVEDNYEFLMNDDLMEHCERDFPDENASSLADSSFEFCIILLEDLSDLLNSLRHRMQPECPGSFQKYLETTLTNEIQHYERRKHSVINSLLSTLRDKFQSFPSSSSRLVNVSVSSDQTHHEDDKKSSYLLRILGELQHKWDETITKIRPVDPLTNQTKFVEDIESDLQKIDTSLDTLASNLPNTTAWMTYLMSLSNVQKFSTAKYYQICLKQIEQYSKTLSTIKELVDHIERINTLSDIQFQNNLHMLSKSVCGLEAKCHTLWLRLLELSIYIDQNIKTNENSIINTEVGKLSSYPDLYSTNFSHALFYENDMSKYSCREVEDQHRTGHESDFKSERSPPLITHHGYSCNKNITSTGVFIVKEELKRRKHNSRSLPNDFNQIIKQLDNALVSGELQRNSEIISTSHKVRRISSQGDLFIKGEDECRICTHKGKNTLTMSEQRGKIKDTTSLMNEIILPNNAEYDLVNAKTQCSDNLCLNSENATDFTLCHDQEDTCRKEPDKDRSDFMSSKSHETETYNKNFTSHIVEPMITGMNGKSESIDLSFIYNSNHLNDSPLNTRVCIMDNYNYAGKNTDSLPRYVIPRNNNLHHFYYLKRIGNKQLKRHLVDSKKERAYVKSHSITFIRNHRKKVSKIICNISRNCISSTSLILHSQITNKPFSRKKPFVSHHDSPEPQIFHFHSSANSDSKVNNNQNYYCESTPDNTSELEQRRWRTQVRTYLNAAAKAEELIRNKYSPTRFDSWLAGLEASNHRLDDRDNINIGDSSNKDFSVIKNQNNNAYDSLSLFTYDLDGVDEKVICKDDDTSSLEDSHEPLLNFWDDYQASLYSNSTDTQAYEPPSVFAEEFPWDDVGSPCFTDFERELNSPSCSRTELIKSLRSDSGSNSEENDYCSTNHGQDTSDILSASTSALFTRKSSLDGSFKMCNNISVNYARGTESWSVDHKNDLLSPESSVRGLRTCPDGGSQHLPSMDTMEVVSNYEMQEMKSRSRLISGFSEHFSPSNYVYYTRRGKFHNLNERKYQTVPRITSRKRKAQIDSFHPLEKQSTIRREFLSFDVNLNSLNDRYFSDIHKGILEHSEIRLLNAETYLQNLVNSIKRNCSIRRPNRSKQANSGNWRHRTTHLLRTAEAHVKLLTNLLDDLKVYSSNVFAVSDDRLSPSFIQDLTPCRSDNDAKSDDTIDDCNHLPYRSIISEALKLKLQWTNFLSSVRHLYYQSSQYEVWNKQLYILQLRMHDLSRLTRQIGLSMYTSKEMDNGSHSEINTHPVCYPAIYDESQANILTCGFKRCFVELDSLNFALEEIQNELNKENCQMPLNNSTATISNTFSLDGRLIQEIDRLSSQLAINRSILQRLIRLFESSHLNNPTHMNSEEYSTDSIESQLETPLVNTHQREVENQVNKVDVNEHSYVCESVENPVQSSDASTLSKEEKPSILSSICNLLHRILPFNSQNYFILLIGGIIFLAYLCYYILTKLVVCNNNSRRPPSPTSTLRCFFSATSNNDNNNNVHVSTGFNKCPLEKDRLSSIIDYTNGVQPY